MARDVGLAGRDLIKSYELGPRGENPPLKSYRCPAGVWTVGWGSTRNVGPNTRITIDEAERRLTNDLEDAEAVVERALQGCPANEHEYAAMVSLAFNCGPVVATSTLIKLHRAGKKAAAAQQFLVWNKMTDPATGKLVVVPGLTRRRAEESALYLRPLPAQDPAPMPQKVEPPKTTSQSTGIRTAAAAATATALSVTDKLEGSGGSGKNIVETLGTVQAGVTGATGIATGVMALRPLLGPILGVLAVALVGALIWHLVKKIRSGEYKL